MATYWDYTGTFYFLFASWGLNWRPPSSQASWTTRRLDKECTKQMNQTKPDLLRNQPGWVSICHRSPPSLTFHWGKQKVFFPLLPGFPLPTPPTLLWNLPALFAFGCWSTLTSGLWFSCELSREAAWEIVLMISDEGARAEETGSSVAAMCVITSGEGGVRHKT